MTEKDREALHATWIKAFHILGVEYSDLLAIKLDMVIADYDHYSRFYHTSDHLIRVIANCTVAYSSGSSFVPTWDRRRITPRDWATAVLGLTYHDVIMDFTKKDNEYRSADRCFQELSWAGVKMDDAQRASFGIRQSCRLDVDRYDDAVVKLMHDADFAILAAPQSLYDTYARQNEKEYSFVEREKFLVGRIDFLDRAIVDMNYSNLAPVNVREETARENMRREHRMLWADPLMRARAIELNKWYEHQEPWELEDGERCSCTGCEQERK